MCLLKNSRIVFTIVVVLLLSSCKNKELVATDYYFNIDSLVSANAAYFEKVKPGLKKRAEINGKKDTTAIVPADSTAWADELHIFRQLGALNNPVNRDNYIIEDNLNDPQSNLTICQYTTSADLPLIMLKVYYQRRLPEIRKIEAVYNEKNALYSSSRFLTLKMEKIYNKTIITSYSVNGGQKMILGDSVDFQINATLVFPERN